VRLKAGRDIQEASVVTSEKGKESVRLLFIPRFDAKTKTSERSPRLLQMLNEPFDVTTMPRSRTSRLVYDPSVPKPARYLLFCLDTFWSVLTCILALRRGRIQVVFGEGTYFSLIGCIAARIRSIPCIWDNHGNIWTLTRVQGKSAVFLKANLVLEHWLFKTASSLIVVSEQEKAIYKEHGFDPSKIAVLPTCVEIPPAVTKDREAIRASLGIKEGEKAMLFFAMLGYDPNREAAEYIVSELAPAVRGSNPEVVFFIAGGGGAIRQREGVRVLGFVEDLGSLVSAADFCIAPIWRGVGILTKVLDMMASGRPTVVSMLAKEGIPELVSGVNCFIANDRNEFIEVVRGLVNRTDKAQDIGREGRRLVEERYSCSVMSAKVIEIVDRAIELGQG
jgi:glycosyltransferase involved in cell wall biosynthesis